MLRTLISEHLNRPKKMGGKFSRLRTPPKRAGMAPALLRLPHKILPLGLARCSRACSSPNLSAIGRTSRVCQVSVIKNIHTAVVRPFIHTPNTPNGKQMPRGSLSRPSPNIPPLARGVREGGKPAKKRAITKLAECVARRRRAHGQVTRV